MCPPLSPCSSIYTLPRLYTADLTIYSIIVYHWASLTAGRYGRFCGFFAGWWNYFAWTVGLAAVSQIVGAMTTSMYALYHPGFVTQKWHIFLAYEIFLALGVASVLWGNRYMPACENIGGVLIIAGCIVTVIVCAAMANPHASDAFVWQEWQNMTGWSDDGFVFCMGMLNGAFAVGTPDVISHLAEEIPRYVSSRAFRSISWPGHLLLRSRSSHIAGQAPTYRK